MYPCSIKTREVLGNPWISQYLPSFGGVRTISQHQFFYREWIRISFPVGREGFTVLKSILPCWWWQIDYCQWKWRRGRLSKDQFHPSVWCLLTFDWLHLTGWGVQLQLLLTELTGVATWCHLMVGIDGWYWCHLLVATCWYWPLLSASLLPLQLAGITLQCSLCAWDWLGLHPSEASCCFCPLQAWYTSQCCWAWDGARKFLQFN